MEVVVFSSCIAARDDAHIIIAVFDGGPPPTCVAILRTSKEGARALAKALGSALAERISDGPATVD